MLGSPRGVVIGATDLAATEAFFAGLGFGAVARCEMDGGLYGASSSVSEVVLGMPGCDRGTIRLVSTSVAAPEKGPFDAGPYAFDVYTRDIEASLALLADAGHPAGPVGRVELGPLVMLQARVRGPDRLPLVLIEANHRRPSRLDQVDDALHSEGHSCVWAVPSVSESVTFWRDVAGLAVPFDAPVVHPEVSRFLELPRPDVPLRMAMACDEAQSPMRLEFMAFEGDRGASPGAPLPLAAGLHAVEWEVADVDATLDELGLTALGRGVAGGLMVASTQAPDGVVFQLRHS